MDFQEIPLLRLGYRLLAVISFVLDLLGMVMRQGVIITVVEHLIRILLLQFLVYFAGYVPLG